MSILLLRTRDVSARVRRAAFFRLSPGQCLEELNAVELRGLLRSGLADCDASVCSAARRFCLAWFDLTADPDAEKCGYDNERTPFLDLTRFGRLMATCLFVHANDTYNTGVEVIMDALDAIFTERPRIFRELTFEGTLSHPTLESISLVRAFLLHCHKNYSEERWEAFLEDASVPNLTQLAAQLRAVLDVLLSCIPQVEDEMIDQGHVEDTQEFPPDVQERLVVATQLMCLAGSMDLGDEVGRRSMSLVIRTALINPSLPMGVIEPALELLQKLLQNEREYTRIVVEIISDIRDEYSIVHSQTSRDPPSSTELSPKTCDRLLGSQDSGTKITNESKAIEARDCRCLELLSEMLRHSHVILDDAPHIRALLMDLVIPAAKHGHRLLQERGVKALCLYCLSDKSLAGGSFDTFLSILQQSPTARNQVLVISALFDILMVFDVTCCNKLDTVLSLLMYTLEGNESTDISDLICAGFCKLLLNTSLRDKRASENQNFLRQSFLDIANRLAGISEVHDSGESNVLPLHDLVVELLTWTDPRNVMTWIQAGETEPVNIHLLLAKDILEALYDPDQHDGFLCALCQALPQLQVVGGVDDKLLLMIDILLNHFDYNTIEEPLSLKGLVSFRDKFVKSHRRALENIDEEDLREDEEITQIYKRVGVRSPLSQSIQSFGDRLSRGTPTSTSSISMALTPSATSSLSSISAGVSPYSTGGTHLTSRSEWPMEDGCLPPPLNSVASSRTTDYLLQDSVRRPRQRKASHRVFSDSSMSGWNSFLS
ncbi:hypothetical protein PUNSTDRAFT_143831 [Punctularia strigosozonata HHB-11173 SS5]|uniref:uncharacterized protein n=1 Tax=Punctularia strigosozonata (strain HHB-11173) TaxID=741275 RepID=UPI0004416FA2|nr:uncharacterized protein PUNSTDRAFT_143831 [Punctularia strigosozonata HHB-11173 SS5]EIN08147.1 hypothetical protein PUNSTDRAFT_143831 [Punctularia strigosozonata HHB-11173 SS5]